jgi:hypothetical protein
MKNPTYRVAIIGTGRMGGLMEDETPLTNQFSKPYSHFGAYTAIEQTEVIAIANRGAKRMQRFSERFGITNTYLDYREMIEKEKPDIVSVTTPSYQRAEPIIFAAEHGVRGIYSEKGLCASLAEADRIAAACRNNNVAFNWGAMRRNHDGYVRLRDAIARGDIGEPRYAVNYTLTDLIKHHPHTLDLVQMLLGDPAPSWVEGRLVEPGESLDPGDSRKGPPDAENNFVRSTLPLPTLDRAGHRFVPPSGLKIADPMVGFFRVGYKNGAEGVFVPISGLHDIDVLGTEGHASASENGSILSIRRQAKGSSEVDEKIIRPTGESPTVCTIRNIIYELETGERTRGNIDVTMQAVEAQFGIAHSHLQDGARVSLPVADRSLYIPGG